MRSRKNYADWSYQARTNRVKIVGCPNAENRKTVSGLFLNDSNADYVGLFGLIGSGGTVKNVGVVDSYFKVLLSGKTFAKKKIGLTLLTRYQPFWLSLFLSN